MSWTEAVLFAFGSEESWGKRECACVWMGISAFCLSICRSTETGSSRSTQPLPGLDRLRGIPGGGLGWGLTCLLPFLCSSANPNFYHFQEARSSFQPWSAASCSGSWAGLAPITGGGKLPEQHPGGESQCLPFHKPPSHLTAPGQLLPSQPQCGRPWS